MITRDRVERARNDRERIDNSDVIVACWLSTIEQTPLRYSLRRKISLAGEPEATTLASRLRETTEFGVTMQ